MTRRAGGVAAAPVGGGTTSTYPHLADVVVSLSPRRRAWAATLLCGGALTSAVVVLLALTGVAPTSALGALVATCGWMLAGWRTRRIAVVADGDEIIFRNALRSHRFRAADVVRVGSRQKLLQLQRQPAVLLGSGKWVVSDAADDLWGGDRLSEAVRALSQRLDLPPGT